MRQIFPTEEQIKQLDAVIGAFEQSRRYAAKTGLVSRGGQSGVTAGEHTLAVLKSIAADLRGALPATADDVRQRLEGRVGDALRLKNEIGCSEAGTMFALAEEFLGAWPSVKVALAAFGAKANTVEE